MSNCLCCTLRSGLHEIPTMITTIPHGLENNHACKRTFDNFPGMLTYVLFLEKCQKSNCMHGYSQIHVDRSIKYRGQLCPILLRRKRTCACGLENNHACTWILDNFPGIICMSAFLKNCQKSICMHGCSPIHVKRSHQLLEFHGGRI